MNNSRSSRAETIALILVFAVLLNPFLYAAAQEPVASPDSTSQPQNGSAPLDSQPPDRNTSDPSSGNAATQPVEDQLPNSPGASQGQSPQTGAVQAPQDQQAVTQTPSRTREPVGTAAAETVPTSGIAASRPAGSALAPAKQRRIRSILIRTGALVGAAAAIGVTMALSQGSPSRPPGAR